MLVLFVLSGCQKNSLPVVAHDFIVELSGLSTNMVLPLSEIQELSPSLIRPESMYIDFAQLTTPKLSDLYERSGTCKVHLGEYLDSPHDFIRALCLGETLSDAWFLKNSIHPLGGTYAWHYINRYPEEKFRLAKFLHVRERPNEFWGAGLLTDSNLTAILGRQPWILQDGILWRLSDGAWILYSFDVWSPVAERHGIYIYTSVKGCKMSLGQGVCVRLSQSVMWVYILLIVAVVGAVALLFVIRFQKYQFEQEQKFIFQILVHELRTPIASLASLVEGFRKSFNQLSDDNRINFCSLVGVTERMKQLAATSVNYLSGTSNQAIVEPSATVQLSDWVGHVVQSYDGIFFCLSNNVTVDIKPYWASLCLNNLLQNAVKHGRPPVRVWVEVIKADLRISVADCGELKSYQLSRIRGSLTHNSGMGLGLVIVRRVAKKIDATLSLDGPPTRFILKLSGVIVEQRKYEDTVN